MTLEAKLQRLLTRPIFTHCFAVPGQTMIDEVDLSTGKTVIYGKTLEDAQREYPGAQLMSIDDFCKSKAALQDTPVHWIQTTAERFDEMLNVLPPIGWNKRGFLVGEAWDHHAVSGKARYAAFIERIESGDGWQEKRYYESSRPMTRDEFKEFCEKS